MEDIQKRLEQIGLRLPEILIPEQSIDLRAWAVVACDQFTSEPEYWAKVDSAVDGIPSTRHLIYPECYLDPGNDEKNIAAINTEMERYLDTGVLRNLGPAAHIIVRTPVDKPPRTGLMVALDLERYDYGENSVSPIRPTEGTIIDRIPARQAVRAGAALELPHVMVLIDDPDQSIIEPLARDLTSTSSLYQTELMENGGMVAAYRDESIQVLEELTAGLEKNADPETFKRRYSTNNAFFIAVGDGNHSLAAAKSHWEATKQNLDTETRATHPARFAMVELVNLYDEGITFEPIHRLLLGIDALAFIDYCRSEAAAHYTPTDLSSDENPTGAELPAGSVRFISGETSGILEFGTNGPSETVDVVQKIVDEYLAGHAGGIDYVHDLATVVTIGTAAPNGGLIMPRIEKAEFFPYIIAHGAYPRKSFSLGESREKRYYLEARIIR